MAILDRVTSVPGLAPGNGYSHAITVTGTIAFVSGQVGVDEHGVVADGLAAQTRLALANLGLVLGRLGAGWADVLRFGWFVLDTAQLQTIRDIRDEYLTPALGGQANPASTLVQVKGLFRPELLVEVEATVTVPAN